jgi:hypothetical protein
MVSFFFFFFLGFDFVQPIFKLFGSLLSGNKTENSCSRSRSGGKVPVDEDKGLNKGMPDSVVIFKFLSAGRRVGA